MVWLASCQPPIKTIKKEASRPLRLLSCKGKCFTVFWVGRMPPLFSVTPFPISTLKWQKTATLGREGSALPVEGGVAWISSNQVSSKNHRALIFAHSLKEPAEPKALLLISLDHNGCSVNNRLVPNILSNYSLWYPIWIQLPFLSLRPSFKLRLHHLMYRFLISLLVSQTLKPLSFNLHETYRKKSPVGYFGLLHKKQ